MTAPRGLGPTVRNQIIAKTHVASNAAAIFPSSRVPSLGKRASADYKRRIVFHASVMFNQLSPVYTVQTNLGSTRVSFCRVNTANPGSTRVGLSCKHY